MGDVAPRTRHGEPAAASPRRVTAHALSEEAWRPFGWIPVRDTDERHTRQRLAFDWNDPHVNVIEHRADEIARSDGALRCTEMYRHDTHTQVLLVLDAAAVLAVAPASMSFDHPDDAQSVRAFLLGRLDAVVLHRGTWHWGPFPLGAEAVHLFNVQGLRYAEDNTRVDLEAAGAALDVLVDPPQDHAQG